MKAFLLVLTLLLSAPAEAQEWPAADRQLFVAAHVLSAIDYLQTRDIVRRPQEFHERNPFLPDSPTMGQVNRYYLIRTAALTAAAFTFPEYRSSILGTYVAVTLIVVGRNAHIGLRAAF